MTKEIEYTNGDRKAFPTLSALIAEIAFLEKQYWEGQHNLEKLNDQRLMLERHLGNYQSDLSQLHKLLKSVINTGELA